MLKNFIFDLGGVVVEYDPKGYLARRFNDPQLEELLMRSIFDSEEWRLLDAGQITRALAEQKMLAAAGRYRYEAQLILDDWRELMTTRLDTVELMTALRSTGYRLFYLSNISEDVFQLFSRRRRFMQLFEGGIPSFAVHLTKPDPQLFSLMLRQFDLDPTETAFIDDSRENIMAAQKMGLTAIPFKDIQDLHKTLAFLGVVVPAKLRHAPRPAKAQPEKPPKQGWLDRLKRQAAASPARQAVEEDEDEYDEYEENI